MNILIVTPAPARSRSGNRITALRWQRLLGELGHGVRLANRFDRQRCDVLVALHARRSADSIQRFHESRQGRPLIVALTGTDLYRDIRHAQAAQRSIQIADRLIVLQSHGVGYLPDELQEKARVIYQSATRPQRLPQPIKRSFEVVVAGHLRRVKDPFRAALAARRLPAESRIQIVHLGAALSDGMRRRAVAEMQRNPRYRWLGEVSHGAAKRRLARSRLLVVSSRLEGAANVFSEALAMRVPILASRMSGSIGMLGDDYPGFFEVGDTRVLSDLLLRAEQDQGFYDRLRQACRRRAPLVDPRREKRDWRRLLAEFP